ncbi:putative ankyrin repeat protein RF_0381 [Haliotis asinina]|uniref:putative ankyrin repeat protein RF_0381 n=1 Tax=Haliotis asinina TaxID=109174 RepID=UPI0035325553
MVNTTLIEACVLGDLRRVEYILSKDTANINIGDENGVTPAMIAAQIGRRDILELLVKRGADLSLTNDEERNVLHVACMEGNMEVAKYIHSQNIIGIESTDGFETTPLMFAAVSGKIEVFSFLIRIGADVSRENANGENILHLSCRSEIVEIVNFILTQNILNVNCTGTYGTTPLMAACYGNGTVFDLLIKRGADTLAKDEDNRNILHHASRGGNEAIVNYILTQTVLDINSKTILKMTPVLFAAFEGKIDVLDLLIERGAYTTAVDYNNGNILHLSCSGGYVESVKHVLKLNIVDINSKEGDGRTAVLVAAFKGNREVFDILVKEGADLSAVDDCGDNILHLACLGENVEIVQRVLALKVVDINSRGADGMTPLLTAVACNARDVIDLLIDIGADPSVVNIYGKNILHLACQVGNEDIVKYVMSNGIVDITTKTKKGVNAAMIAMECGYSSISKLLSQGSQVE